MPLTSSDNAHEFRVDGMTCEHCKLSVTEAVPTGRLTVIGDVDDPSIAAAVSDAGYRVLSTGRMQRPGDQQL